MKKNIYTLFSLLLALGIGYTAQAQLLWGVTSSGGNKNSGVLFSYDPIANIYTAKAHFDSVITGGFPRYGLAQAPNGKLYGTNLSGGTNNKGTLYEYDPASNTLSVKYNFDSIHGTTPNGIVVASNGKIYGTTYRGGSKNHGTFFEYDPVSGLLTTTLNIDSADGNPYLPSGYLIQHPSGKLYGVSMGGGVDNDGVLYEYDIPTSSITKKANLDVLNALKEGGSKGEKLLVASNGKLYGMASHAGGGYGSVYEYTISTNTINLFEDFDMSGGYWPLGSLIEGANGKIYGTSTWGGTDLLAGALFEYDYNTNTFNALVTGSNSSIEGTEPQGALTLASNGKYYGMAHAGGANNAGTLFEYELGATFVTKKIDLSTASGSIPICAHLISATVSNVGIAKVTTNDQINFFPNPFSQQFTISTKQISGGGTFSLYDIMGRLVMEEKITANTLHSVSALGLPSGAYTAMVSSNEGVKCVRMIKE